MNTYRVHSPSSHKEINIPVPIYEMPEVRRPSYTIHKALMRYIC